MRRSRKPFGLYKVTRVRIPPPPPFWLRKLPKTGAFFVLSPQQANTAEEGFEPARARSVKKTRHGRVFSTARSAPADRINFELRSKFGHPSYSTTSPSRSIPAHISNTYTTLQRCQKMSFLECDVHVCIWRAPSMSRFACIRYISPPQRT